MKKYFVKRKNGKVDQAFLAEKNDKIEDFKEWEIVYANHLYEVR